MPGSKEPLCKRYTRRRPPFVFNFIMKKSKSKSREQTLQMKTASGASKYSTLTYTDISINIFNSNK